MDQRGGFWGRLGLGRGLTELARGNRIEAVGRSGFGGLVLLIGVRWALGRRLLLDGSRRCSGLVRRKRGSGFGQSGLGLRRRGDSGTIRIELYWCRLVAEGGNRSDVEGGGGLAPGGATIATAIVCAAIAAAIPSTVAARLRAGSGGGRAGAEGLAGKDTAAIPGAGKAELRGRRCGDWSGRRCLGGFPALSVLSKAFAREDDRLDRRGIGASLVGGGVVDPIERA